MPVPANSFPDYRGSLKSSTLTLAIDLQARAAADTDPARSRRLALAADLLERCARSCSEHWGWRCGMAICPRCECRKAIRYRKRMEGRLHKSATTFKHITTTVAADDPQVGLQWLRKAFGELKRRVAWRTAIAGGESHLQVKASRPGSARACNVHFHTVVELRPGRKLGGERLRDLWRVILARYGAVGNLAVTGVERHWAIYRD